MNLYKPVFTVGSICGKVDLVKHLPPDSTKRPFPKENFLQIPQNRPFVSRPPSFAKKSPANPAKRFAGEGEGIPRPAELSAPPGREAQR